MTTPDVLTEQEREALTSVFAGVIYVRDREALFKRVEGIVAARVATERKRANILQDALERLTAAITGWRSGSELEAALKQAHAALSKD